MLCSALGLYLSALVVGVGGVISLADRLETLYSVLGRCHIPHPAGHPGTWGLDHLESHWREMSEASPHFNDKYSSFTSWLLHGQREVWIRREMTLYPRCAWWEVVRTGKGSARSGRPDAPLEVALAHLLLRRPPASPRATRPLQHMHL